MLIEVVCACLAALFVFLGYQGRLYLLQNNPCDMTYTSMQKSEVPVMSTMNSSALLYRHPSDNGVRKLAKYPVLFIPGNSGSADQVRSFSSPMHNEDGFFQYFAIHFKYPFSAIHGSSILTQAIYVNDALRTIQQLYKEERGSNYDKNANFKIIVIGHSYGGMVARTAMLLNNHPQPCLVSDIVMLSTPIVGPAHSPDSSMEALYKMVNSVWYHSYSNESAACQNTYDREAAYAQMVRFREAQIAKAGKKADSNGDQDDREAEFLADTSARFVSRESRPLSYEKKCALCVANTRLIQIHGGDIDILVPSYLTSLDALFPRAANLTARAIEKSKSSGGFFGGGGGRNSGGIVGLLYWLSPMTWARVGFLGLYDWGRDIYRISWSMMMGANKANSTSAVSNSRDSNNSDNSSLPAGEDLGMKGEEAAPPITATPPLSTNQTTSAPSPTGPYAYLESLTMEEWEMHISPFLQSYQYTIRSSQLDKVGFPVDHNAILWCRQLVNQVSNAMRKLASDGFLAPHMPISPTGSGSTNPKGKDMALPQVLNGNSTASGGYFTRLLPYSRKSNSRKYVSQALKETARMINPVATFHLKNATSHAYNTIAPIDEFNYIARRLSGIPHHTPRGEDWEKAKLVEREKGDKKKEATGDSDGTISMDKVKSNLPTATALGFLQAVGVWYVSNALPYILSGHLLMAILILAIPIRRRLTNYQPASDTPGGKDIKGRKRNSKDSDMMMDLDVLRFQVLFHLEDLLPLAQATLAPVLDQILPPTVLQASWYQKGNFNLAIVLGVLSAVGYSNLMVLWYIPSSTHLVFAYKWSIVAVISLFSAYFVRVLLLIFIYAMRYILATTNDILWYIFTATLYRPFVQKMVKKQYKSLRKTYLPLLPRSKDSMRRWTLPLSMCSMAVMAMAMSSKENRIAIGVWSYGVNILVVTTCFTSTLGVLRSILVPPSDAGMYHYHTNIALLYIPILILQLPSLTYSASLLFAPIQYFASGIPLFEVFGPDRITTLLSLLFIAIHFIVIDMDSRYSYYDGLSSIELVTSLLGREQYKNTKDKKKTVEDDRDSDDENEGVCIHEDGGRYAVFTPLTPSEIRTTNSTMHSMYTQRGYTDKSISSLAVRSHKWAEPPTEIDPGSVTLGSTYKVISCGCFKDARLRDREEEWCSWCQCKFCGGKDRYGGKSQTGWRDWSGSSNPNSSKKNIAPYSANQVLCLAIVCCASMAVYYSGAVPYKSLYLSGMVALCFLVRDAAIYFNFTLI